jgi:hypothetical protein
MREPRRVVLERERLRCTMASGSAVRSVGENSMWTLAPCVPEIFLLTSTRWRPSVLRNVTFSYDPPRFGPRGRRGLRFVAVVSQPSLLIFLSGLCPSWGGTNAPGSGPRITSRSLADEADGRRARVCAPLRHRPCRRVVAGRSPYELSHSTRAGLSRHQGAEQ